MKMQQLKQWCLKRQYGIFSNDSLIFFCRTGKSVKTLLNLTRSTRFHLCNIVEMIQEMTQNFSTARFSSKLKILLSRVFKEQNCLSNQWFNALTTSMPNAAKTLLIILWPLSRRDVIRTYVFENRNVTGKRHTISFFSVRVRAFQNVLEALLQTGWAPYLVIETHQSLFWKRPPAGWK